MLTRDRLQRIRIRKIEELKKLGVNAYPSLCHREQIIDQAQRMEGRQVVVAGRLTNLRGHGKIIFADLKDQSGKIQIAFKADLLKPQSFSLLSFVDVSDFLSISGKVGKTQAGEMTVFADNFQIISKAIRSLPDQWYGLKDIEERYRKRYLDLVMNEKVFGVFRIRAQIIHFIREYLDSRGYIEVETPVLQPVYGGGLARPFKTYHNALGIPLYLRISTELYLKRLIVGGFEKVYEIARLFRNEGIDRNHAPEFTMLETMEAYIDYRENMKLVEEMTEYIVKKIFGGTKIQYLKNFIDFETPWKRVTMVEAVKEATGFDYYQIKNIEEAKKQARDLGVELEESENTVGFILASIFKNKVETTLIQPTIIYDFPVETSPLAKRKEEDPRFVERFEHFIAGMECSNNYSELNDPQELEKRLVDERKKEKLGDQEAHQMDYDFIEALEYGMPPTSGIGPGIDRLVMILTNSPNLREVILFPTMRPREAIKPAKAEEIKNLPSCKQTPINIPTTDSSKFSLIDNAVKNKFPGTRVGVAYIKDVKIEKTSAELELYKKEVIDSLQGLRTADIDSFSTIAAYRKLFKGFGVDWHSRRPSPDALLRRIALGK
ncbi:lysine--tRNA ligase, partial [Candidatus Gottesmanbacteria bacterium]|nr:lysine--tRNA ligase [Candidatus Gottesmanbacteria bacterium]